MSHTFNQTTHGKYNTPIQNAGRMDLNVNNSRRSGDKISIGGNVGNKNTPVQNADQMNLSVKNSLGSPSDSTASSPTPSSVESYEERDIGVHPREKVFNFPTNSNNESGGPVTLTGLTPISPSNEVSTDHNVSSLSPQHPQD